MCFSLASKKTEKKKVMPLPHWPSQAGQEQ